MGLADLEHAVHAEPAVPAVHAMHEPILPAAAPAVHAEPSLPAPIHPADSTRGS